MARRHYDLPSLTTLAVFEAAARNLSFKQAALELNVTPGAVSRQIKALETELCTQLFERLHRGVVLTGDGADLYEAVGDSFARMSVAVHAIRSRDLEANITVGATTAFASLWLMPRLSGFWRSHRDVTINHVISDHARDIDTAQVDLRFRYGTGHWPGDTASLLFDDRIYPVAGPEFASENIPETLEDLLGLPLLQLNSADPTWIDWPDWFAALGISERPRKVRSFTNYGVALQAAQDNQGVVVGWHGLVAPLIAQGRLQRLGTWEIAAPGSHYVTWSADRPLDEAAQALKDWLLEVDPALFD